MNLGSFWYNFGIFFVSCWHIYLFNDLFVFSLFFHVSFFVFLSFLPLTLIAIWRVLGYPPTPLAVGVLESLLNNLEYKYYLNLLPGGTTRRISACLLTW